MRLSEIFEITYAAVTNRLCFFAGTGFSKAVKKMMRQAGRGYLKTFAQLSVKGVDWNLYRSPELAALNAKIEMLFRCTVER